MLDFYCNAARLAVEVDGQHHWIGDAQVRDAARDDRLSIRRICVLRLPARLIFKDLDTAIRMIEYAARREL